MADEAAGVRVFLNAEAFEEDEAVSRLLAEFMFAVASEAGNPARRRDFGGRFQVGIVASICPSNSAAS